MSKLFYKITCFINWHLIERVVTDNELGADGKIIGLLVCERCRKLKRVRIERNGWRLRK